MLRQREDASAATGGGAGKLQQAHDQHLQRAGNPHRGGIRAARKKMRKSGNLGFTAELGNATALTPMPQEKNF